MTDVEFLDSLEFRASIRKRDNAVIELTADESYRLDKIRGKWLGRFGWRADRVVLLNLIQQARECITNEITRKLTHSL